MSRLGIHSWCSGYCIGCWPHWYHFHHVRVYLQGWGAAYGTAKSAMGIAVMGVMRPELIIRSLLPVIMAGIIALYGLVVGLMMNGVCTDIYLCDSEA